MGRKKIKIPPNFYRIATEMTLNQVSEEWNISEDTARKWFKWCGIKPIRKNRAIDNYKQINYCLHCAKKPEKCNGYCKELHRLAD